MFYCILKDLIFKLKWTKMKRNVKMLSPAESYFIHNLWHATNAPPFDMNLQVFNYISCIYFVWFVKRPKDDRARQELRTITFLVIFQMANANMFVSTNCNCSACLRSFEYCYNLFDFINKLFKCPTDCNLIANKIPLCKMDVVCDVIKQFVDIRFDV